MLVHCNDAQEVETSLCSCVHLQFFFSKLAAVERRVMNAEEPKTKVPVVLSCRVDCRVTGGEKKNSFLLSSS